MSLPRAALRAGPEGLREAVESFLARWDMGPPLPRNDLQLVVARMRAALRDTGPHPDPVSTEGLRADVVVTYLVDDYKALLEAILTPRTETSEP